MLNLRDPLCLLTETDQSKAPAYGRMPEPSRHAMLARDLDRRLGSPVCRIKLASEIVQSSGPYQGEGEAAGVCEPLGEGEASFDLLQGTVGKAEVPKGPRRIQPARDARALRVEQKVGRILPGRDRIVDRDAFVYRCRRIGKPAEEEQRCP